MITPPVPPKQASLFPVSPEESAPHLFPPSPHPCPVVAADKLLTEVERDWWSLLDPRNWRDPGPTDDEILARYRVVGTPMADEWPNVSGSRMYLCVWPMLQQTYHVHEDRLLSACHTCRDRHLLGALTHTRTNAVAYSISDDLIDTHTWNGDSWATYIALTRFAGQPIYSLESLVTHALQVAIPRAAAALHMALAAHHSPPMKLRPSKRTSAQEHAQNIDLTVSHTRDRLAMLHRCRHSPSPARTLLEHATIGPRFQDPAWPALTQGDSLPSGLIDQLLLSHTLLDAR